MALDDFNKAKVKKIVGGFCINSIPVRLRTEIQLDYSIRGNSVTLIERRKGYQDPLLWIDMKIAQFRYDIDTGMWSLFWWRHTGRWYNYENFEPSINLQLLVDEVNEDPYGIFFG